MEENVKIYNPYHTLLYLTQMWIVSILMGFNLTNFLIYNLNKIIKMI